MDTSELPKAAAEGYSPVPFFFRDEYAPGAFRWVAWPGSVAGLKELFYRVIGFLPDEVNVLLKVRQWGESEPGEERWWRFHATCSRERLVEAVGEHEGLVFQDGDVQLCVMCGPGGDYLAVDDHGLFFLYTEDEGFAVLGHKLGLEERREALIGDQPHGHLSSDVFAGERARFAEELGLLPVDASTS